MKSLSMPIRAAPYKHQQEAFAFACRLFGLPPQRLLAEGGDALPVSRGCAYLMEMG